MTSYVNPFTGQTIQPSQVGYESLTIATDTILQWPINGNDNLVVANIIDITATANGLHLYLPDATQVSTGQSILINNIGADTFTVVKSDGTTIIAIPSGISEYIYLTNNTTTAGTWVSVTFGAGTSAANASALAGYGLTPISTTLNQAYNVIKYYSTTTLSSIDRAEFAVWAGGVGTFYLPSAASVGNNWFCMVANNGSGILTLTPQGTDTINGNASQQLQLTESLVIVSNGTGWNTFGYGRSNAFAYTQLALNVTGGTLTLTSAQGANTIQEYSGILTSNQIVIVPSTVQLYTFTNNATGSFSFTVKTSAVGGATVVVPQGNSLVLICDGTNVYNAASGSSSSITSLTLGNGSLSVPSLKFVGDTNSGMYLPSTGTVGFVIANALAGFFDSTGFTSVNGISGGTF
jgi:hypothetical protein